ncbi:hypothetical protein ES5_16426 [Dietzia cinnamea P4]|nr:hypothetical protein ES5_16426 [Dietzia cinnamea P4]
MTVDTDDGIGEGTRSCIGVDAYSGTGGMRVDMVTTLRRDGE